MRKAIVIPFFIGLTMMVALNAQVLDKDLDHIILYKVTDMMATSAPLTGVGMNGFKLAVGDEMIIYAKGVDANGNEVAIWPTWKADKELSISVVEGRSRTVVVKAVKAGEPLFVTAIYKTDAGKKVTVDAMGSVK